jgi:hypothetical protein
METESEEPMRHLSLAVVLAAVPWIACAQSDFNWNGTLSPGQTLEIKGVNGSIRAELASGPMIEVSARKTATKSDPASVRIDVVTTSDGVTICSVYPSEGSQPNDCQGGRHGHSSVRDNDVVVDYTVRVPANIRFAPRTVNGTITALNLRSDVDATNVNGNVKVSTTGLAHATSVNGSLDVTVGAASWTAPLEFKTVNGSIDLTLPPGVNADLHATSVNGAVSSDFPMNVTGKLERRDMRARIGGGGSQLEFSTVNGGITLHQGARM